MVEILAATETSQTELALVAIVASVITALFKLLNDNTRALKGLQKSTEARTEVERESSNKTIAVLERTANEAEQRNGHLGEQNIEIAKISKEISKKLDKISTQEVHDQHVHHQVIEEKKK